MLLIDLVSYEVLEILTIHNQPVTKQATEANTHYFCMHTDQLEIMYLKDLHKILLCGLYHSIHPVLLIATAIEFQQVLPYW